MMADGKRVLVVGGGVVGAACAYFLSRSGWAVTVLDAGGFGQGCSHANCGFISPSHVLPLASPGALRVALGSLFKRNSPLKVRARLDPALWSWFYHFAKRCNHADMMAAGVAIQALLNSSRRLYQEIIESEGMECEWQTHGMLFVLQTAAGMEHFAHTNKLLSESFNIPAKRFDGAALTEFEPALKPGLAGGWFYEGDAHLRPDKLMSSWEKVLKARGVMIREHCRFESLLRDGARARAARTAAGDIEADAFVFATGALTSLLSRELGCRIPIQPGKGYSITMARPGRCPQHPLIFEEHRVAVTPMDSGYRLGSTMEFAGYDASLRRDRLDLLREGARHYLVEPYGEPVQEEWFGWRPMTYDGKPIIDRSPAWANVLTAAGHNMLGVSMAPATGRLVAELLNEGKPHIDPAPYSVKRFN